MKGRERLLWLLLIVIMIGLIGYGGYNTFKTSKKITALKLENEQLKIIGTDPKLQKEVEALENNLAKRLSFVFQQGPKDPLNLLEVVRTRNFLQKLGIKGSLEDENKMRLTTTFINSNGNRAAIIKKGSMSKVVGPGDVIEGYTVADISERRVTLERGGQRIQLQNELSPETIFEMEIMQRLSN